MNNKHTLFIIAAIIIIALIGYAIYKNTPSQPEQALDVTNTYNIVGSATYFCSSNKTISATYMQPADVTNATGTVEVSLNGGTTTTLTQTRSADGARYADANESLVIWNKGNGVIVMRNNEMDLGYTNCATK